MSAFETGPLAGLEPLCVDTPMNAGDQPDGGARGYALVSIAISLKRIADAIDAGSKPDGYGPFANLFAALDDASHNHAQRMSR
jgi:hypothetical protein